jgi:hypothetical protein
VILLKNKDSLWRWQEVVWMASLTSPDQAEMQDVKGKRAFELIKIRQIWLAYNSLAQTMLGKRRNAHRSRLKLCTAWWGWGLQWQHPDKQASNRFDSSIAFCRVNEELRIGKSWMIKLNRWIGIINCELAIWNR